MLKQENQQLHLKNNRFGIVINFLNNREKTLFLIDKIEIYNSKTMFGGNPGYFKISILSKFKILEIKKAHLQNYYLYYFFKVMSIESFEFYFKIMRIGMELTKFLNKREKIFTKQEINTSFSILVKSFIK